MADARVLLAFAALAALALLFVERGVPSAFAPICALGSAGLWVVLFGCFGALRLGGWLLYLACAAAAAWVLWRCIRQKKAPGPLGYGFWFFVGAGLCVICLLWAKQPMFTGWDEFSLWGTGGKLMKIYDEFYVTAPMGWIWPQPQTPLLMTFSYIFQFFGEGFAEWQTYVAVDVFQFAAMAAVLAPFDAKRRSGWVCALPAGIVCLLTPFMFQYYETLIKLSDVYLTSLADLPMGLCFAAALCCWYGSRRRLADLVPVCITLAALTLTKDIGMTLALVVCALILIDELLARHEAAISLKKRLGMAFAKFGIAFGAVALPFVGWSAYTSAAAGVDRLQDAGGKLNASLLDFPGLFLKDLFASPQSDFFREINWGMRWQFTHNRTTMLGAGLVVVCAILAMLAVAAFITKDKGHRRRCVLFLVFSPLGFAAYYLLLTMTYLYMMRPEQALESYNRYVYPYYIGWLLCALLLLGHSCTELPVESRRLAWRPAVGSVALLGLCAAMMLRMWQLVPGVYTLLGANPAEYNERRAFAQEVRQFRQKLPVDGRTFYVNTDDDGHGWFTWSYELLPWQLDYSFGGGSLIERTQQPDGTLHKRIISADELAQYLLDTGCDRVFIDYINYGDSDFVALYGRLFEDGLAANKAGLTNLYAVVPEGGGVTLAPVLEGGQTG